MNLGRQRRTGLAALALLAITGPVAQASVLVESNARTQAASGSLHQQTGTNGAYTYDIWHGTNPSNAALISGKGVGSIVGPLPGPTDPLAGAAVSIDAVTGRVRSINNVPSPSWLGSASTRAEIADEITILSPTLTLTLDAFFDSFSITAPIPNPAFDYKALVTYYLSVNLREIEGDASFVIGIVMQNSFENPFSIPGGDWIRTVRVTRQHGTIDEDVVTNFSSSPTHVSNAMTVDTSALVGRAFTLNMTMTSTASCAGITYWSALGGACTATAASWNTGYVGLDGQFLSQNGYQYLGLVDETGTPEPSSLALAVTGLVFGLGLWRRGSHKQGNNLNCSTEEEGEGGKGR